MLIPTNEEYRDNRTEGTSLYVIPRDMIQWYIYICKVSVHRLRAFGQIVSHSAPCAECVR